MILVRWVKQAHTHIQNEPETQGQATFSLWKQSTARFLRNF